MKELDELERRLQAVGLTLPIDNDGGNPGDLWDCDLIAQEGNE